MTRGSSALLWRIVVTVSALQSVLATQVPLYPIGRGREDTPRSFDYPGPDGSSDLSRWRLDEPPNPNATGHLVFETVHSLLQHWPNTRMRNGHTIVPGVIPTGTLLYHGAIDSKVPETPDWVGLNPEESTAFCLNPAEEGCWHLTLATTRPLRVLYFDGTSAAKLEYGTMDTQDILAWGKVLPEKTWMEQQRILSLCQWGQQHGVDGFVRMEMDFEVMICNFTSGVRTISFLNLANPDPILLPPLNQSTPLPRVFENMHAGSWSNDFPGDTRIQLDIHNLVSFYDTGLVPSLVPVRFGKERWDHRILNISDHDIFRVQTRIEEVLTTPGSGSNTVDWMTLIRTIVHRYANRLELTQYLLNATANGDPEAAMDSAKKAQVQLRLMLTPYIPSSTAPFGGGGSVDWARPIFRLCATSHIDAVEGLNMTPSEELLLQAIGATTREICRVVTSMWASGVVVGLDDFLKPSNEDPNIEVVTNLARKWKAGIDGLIRWLDWNVWVRCRPECGPEEMCYLTTWPVGVPRSKMPLPKDSPFPLPDRWKIEPDWERPQPRCIRRVWPYDFD